MLRRATIAWLSLLLLSSCGGPAPSGSGIPTAVTLPSPPASAAGSSNGRPTSSPVAPSLADWPVYHRDPARTGNDEAFPAFDGSLTRAWSTPLDGAVYAEPLVLGGRLIAATEGDTVYALDPASGRVSWQRNLGTRAREAPRPRSGA